MKKIALFIPSMYPSGGAERVTHQLAQDLSGEYDVTIFTLVDNVFEHAKYKKISLGFSNTPLSKIWSLLYGPLALARASKINNITTIISHMERANFIALLAKKISRIKTICVVHNSKYLGLRKNKVFIKRLYSKADRVITVSKGIEEKLISLYNLTNTKTIYNYFDLGVIDNKLSKPLSTKDQSLFNKNLYTFINIGRLTEQKGQDVLISSFAQANISDSQLIIIGEGGEREKLESLCIELGVEKKVHLIGTRNNVFPLLKASDCFVLSSRWEGFGLVLVEALAAGLPVISTDCLSGPREILTTPKTNFGTLVPVNDTTKLSHSMIKIKTKDVNKTKQKSRADFFSREVAITSWNQLL